MTSALVVVCSTRAAAGTAEDRTGPVIADWLRAQGFADTRTVVVADGDPVGAVLVDAVERGVPVVLTTGGTGLAPSDETPEQTRRVLDREIPGIPEVLRQTGVQHNPLASLSRGVAGVAGRSVVINLPGSPGGVRDGLAVLEPILSHLVDQVGGGDHPESVSRSRA